VNGTQAADRRAWISHRKLCWECKHDRYCAEGRDLIAAMSAGMAPEEELPGQLNFDDLGTVQ